MIITRIDAELNLLNSFQKDRGFHITIKTIENIIEVLISNKIFNPFKGSNNFSNIFFLIIVNVKEYFSAHYLVTNF
jgi:hypothetical protein